MMIHSNLLVGNGILTPANTSILLSTAGNLPRVLHPLAYRLPLPEGLVAQGRPREGAKSLSVSGPP